MGFLHTVIASDQVNVFSVNVDHEIGSIIPELIPQDEIFCLRIRFIQKGSQSIVFFNASRRRRKGKGTCSGEKHHDSQQAGNQFFHKHTPLN